jgi:hypothetical protein
MIVLLEDVELAKFRQSHVATCQVKTFSLILWIAPKSRVGDVHAILTVGDQGCEVLIFDHLRHDMASYWRRVSFPWGW